jgi:hypothetical protein
MPISGGVDDSDLRICSDLRAIHLPDRDAMGSIVLEQQVGLAIAVEIAGGLEVPSGSDRSDLRVRRDLCAVHLPDRNAMGGVVDEQQIGLAVAVEIASSLEVPGGGKPSFHGHRCPTKRNFPA